MDPGARASPRRGEGDAGEGPLQKSGLTVNDFMEKLREGLGSSSGAYTFATLELLDLLAAEVSSPSNPFTALAAQQRLDTRQISELSIRHSQSIVRNVLADPEGEPEVPRTPSLRSEFLQTPSLRSEFLQRSDPKQPADEGTASTAKDAPERVFGPDASNPGMFLVPTFSERFHGWNEDLDHTSSLLASVAFFAHAVQLCRVARIVLHIAAEIYVMEKRVVGEFKALDDIVEICLLFEPLCRGLEGLPDYKDLDQFVAASASFAAKATSRSGSRAASRVSAAPSKPATASKPTTASKPSTPTSSSCPLRGPAASLGATTTGSGSRADDSKLPSTSAPDTPVLYAHIPLWDLVVGALHDIARWILTHSRDEERCGEGLEARRAFGVSRDRVVELAPMARVAECVVASLTGLGLRKEEVAVASWSSERQRREGARTCPCPGPNSSAEVGAPGGAKEFGGTPSGAKEFGASAGAASAGAASAFSPRAAMGVGEGVGSRGGRKKSRRIAQKLEEEKAIVEAARLRARSALYWTHLFSTLTFFFGDTCRMLAAAGAVSTTTISQVVRRESSSEANVRAHWKIWWDAVMLLVSPAAGEPLKPTLSNVSQFFGMGLVAKDMVSAPLLDGTLSRKFADARQRLVAIHRASGSSSFAVLGTASASSFAKLGTATHASAALPPSPSAEEINEAVPYHRVPVSAAFDFSVEMFIVLSLKLTSPPKRSDFLQECLGRGAAESWSSERSEGASWSSERSEGVRQGTEKLRQEGPRRPLLLSPFPAQRPVLRFDALCCSQPLTDDSLSAFASPVDCSRVGLWRGLSVMAKLDDEHITKRYPLGAVHLTAHTIEHIRPVNLPRARPYTASDPLDGQLRTIIADTAAWGRIGE